MADCICRQPLVDTQQTKFVSTACASEWLSEGMGRSLGDGGGIG
jgi:hypothetical protein